MIGNYPKIRNCAVGKCPLCNANMFEEEVERRYGGPDNESVYYEKIIACSGCNYFQEYEYEEPEYEAEDNEIVLSDP